MEPLSTAAFSSWSLHPPVLIVLLATLWIYFRGWRTGRKLLRGERDFQRLSSFCAGTFAIFLALESPLNSFDAFFLSAHMAQHLLLIMVAPPLLLLGQPMLPILRGLPKPFVKEALGPFLTAPFLHRFFHTITALPFAWMAAALSTILWHTPALYELACPRQFGTISSTQPFFGQVFSSGGRSSSKVLAGRGIRNGPSFPTCSLQT